MAMWGAAADAVAVELAPAQVEFFEAKVRPLLSEHCYDCHSERSEKVKGGLLLDTREGWQAGGDSGEVIDPGRPEQSLLVETVRYGNPDLQMPPKYKLSDDQIGILEAWVAMGAPDPRSGEVAGKAPAVDWEKGRSHWAFQPVSDPAPPVVRDRSWPRDELDHFVLAKLESAGLGPVGDADRYRLLRRVTLDLTGLPPSPQEVKAFVEDPATDDEALAKVVDRLLALPAFGERWGRHWLDVARYADSVGKTRNVPFPYAWRYRNQVIDAINADQPYDAFLMEQIAGDLLPASNPADREAKLVSTGWLALGSMDLNERDREQFFLDRIDDQMDTLGRATMALTLGCARCHDHKFDPVAQRDYYALAGIFGSTRTLSGQSSRQGQNRNYFDPAQLVSLTDGEVAASRPSAEDLQRRMRELRERSQRKGLPEVRRRALAAEMAELRTQLMALADGKKPGKKGPNADQAKVDPSAPLAMAATEGEIADLALRVRGEPDIKGEVVPRGFPTVLQHPATPGLADDSSGRLELARWLTAPEHPLTARVMVNRVWAHLIGRGIVDTVDNFGLSGSAPTHPELLDHLSTRFVSGGWSVKSLVRDIALSRTYRLAVEYPAAQVTADEGNEWLWRANLRRLEAEAIRDSVLAVGGLLDPVRPEGAPFDASVGGDLSRPNNRRPGAGDVIQRPFRSVYLPVFRSRLPGMFTVFDFAEPDQVNGQRDVTTVPTQALFLLNNAFMVDASSKAAKDLLRLQTPGEEERVREAFLRVLGRHPAESEVAASLAFLCDGPTEPGWGAFVQSLFASAEFRYRP